MMPVSVPKVLVRPQGERQYEWMDLWESYVRRLRLALLVSLLLPRLRCYLLLLCRCSHGQRAA